MNYELNIVTLNLNDIKRLVSSIILTIGICGLLYSLPSFSHPMFSNFMGISFYMIFSSAIFLVGLITKFLTPKESMPRWKKSIHFSMISLTLFLCLFIFTNPTPGYAPHTFAYNFGFVKPVFYSSLGFSLVGLILFYTMDKFIRVKMKWTFRLLPVLSLAPIVFFLILYSAP